MNASGLTYWLTISVADPGDFCPDPDIDLPSEKNRIQILLYVSLVPTFGSKTFLLKNKAMVLFVNWNVYLYDMYLLYNN
jgi:hypothetical protein